MGLLKQITSLFGDQQLRLRMELAQEGIRVSLWKGQTLVSHDELRSEKFLRRLPLALANYLLSQTPISQRTFLMTFPQAKQLQRELQLTPTKSVILECQALDALHAGWPPSNFEIRWIYNKPQKVLERQLIGAERHLGNGWFQHDQVVWGPSTPLPAEIVRFLNAPKVSGADIATLISVTIPTLVKWGIACRCGLVVRTDFNVQLKILKMQERSLDVLVATNVPELLAELEPLDESRADSPFISGSTLLFGLRPLMSHRMLQLARSGGVQHLSGTEMLAFIQDDIRPNAQRLGVDIASINAKYSITDASQLASSWQLEKRRIQGIGGYWANRVLRGKAQQFSLQALIIKAKNGERFSRVENGWLEFTPAFEKLAKEAVSKNTLSFQLPPREVLGTQPGPFPAEVMVPAFDVQSGGSEIECAEKFIEMLRDIGLPGALSGLQMDIATVMAKACANLLGDNPKAKILWIVPKRKADSVASALQQNRIPHSKVTSNNAPVSKTSVVITTPEQRLPLATEWTFVIFHDLDIFVFSDDYVGYGSQLKRLWAFALFSRADWYQVVPIAQKIMNVLRLSPNDVQAFRNKCLQNYSAQADNLLARLASPFKKVLTSNNSDAGAIPIPPRRSPLPTTATRDVFRPQITINVSHDSSAESFVAQAKRYENRSETSAEYQPFKQYWPTYQAMNPSQQQWYFYWRTRLRENEFLNTDLSYIFVHVYEVINLIGFSTPQAAWTHIVKVWKHYRALYPNLDGYLVDWLADFTVVYNLSDTALDWYRTALEEDAKVSDSDLALEAWLMGSHDFSKLNSSLLYNLANYSPKENKFYQEYNAALQIEMAYKKSLQSVDDYLRRVGTKGLFDRYKSEAPRSITRVPFGNALYEGKRETIRIAKIYTRTSTKLSSDLSAIIRFTENVLRKQVKFKSKLRGIEIPDEWAAAIDHAFVVPVVRREISLNMSNIAALQQESEEIRQRLMVQETDEILPSNEDPVMDVANKPNEEATPTYTIRPADSPDGLLTDLVPIAAIIGLPDGITAKLLRTLQENGWEAPHSVIQSALGEEYFLNVELDKINERATVQIGDSLIFEEPNKLVVAEDYRDEIEYILDHPDDKAQLVMPTLTPPAEKEYSDLGDEWAIFAQHLKLQHWQALAVIVTATEVNPGLDAVARSAYTTAALLIEDINAFALDSIGDIVIDTHGDYPSIEDEDSEGLHSLIVWANAQALLEN